MFVAKRQLALTLTCVALLLGFITNVAFVVIARTAFLYAPILVVMFGARFFSRKAALWFCAIGVFALTLVWLTSPFLRFRAQQISFVQTLNSGSAKINSLDGSLDQRLQYWHASWGAIKTAPIFGHGTGATRKILQENAAVETGIQGKVLNPHNQTLYVAVQWGIFGCLILFAMWGAHFMLFWRTIDIMGWIGLIVVTQNIVSSIVNSHLFDFHEGWIYVLGVGVAGATMVRHERSLTRRHNGDARPKLQLEAA